MGVKANQFNVTKILPAYWRITFTNPPLNLVNPETILELQEIVGRIESAEELGVAVFDSEHPDFFMARYDLCPRGGDACPARPHGLANVD